MVLKLNVAILAYILTTWDKLPIFRSLNTVPTSLDFEASFFARDPISKSVFVFFVGGMWQTSKLIFSVSWHQNQIQSDGDEPHSSFPTNPPPALCKQCRIELDPNSGVCRALIELPSLPLLLQPRQTHTFRRNVYHEPGTQFMYFVHWFSCGPPRKIIKKNSYCKSQICHAE